MIYRLGERVPEFRGEDYWVADNATIIGSVILENNVGIWFNAVLRGDNEIIRVGENSNVQDGVEGRILCTGDATHQGANSQSSSDQNHFESVRSHGNCLSYVSKQGD